MRFAIAMLMLCIGGCTSIHCKPEFQINEWHPPFGAPLAKPGQNIVQTEVANFESVTFLSCKYND